MMRSRAEVDEENHRIIITEIPYMVIKSDLLKTIAEKVRDKVIEGLTDVRDESGRAGMRIVIEYRRDANGHVILNQLYKYTKLQDTCAINMLALVNGEPKVLPLKAILSEYIKFQEEVITRRVKFDLAKALHEEHIFEGYKIAIDNIEEVIKIIRSSADVAESRENLKNRFALSDEQAQAIVSMTLGRLSGMERDKVEGTPCRSEKADRGVPRDPRGRKPDQGNNPRRASRDQEKVRRRETHGACGFSGRDTV